VTSVGDVIVSCLLFDAGESTTLERKTVFHSRLKMSICKVGTTEFRAPELWDSKGYGVKVDIWAFGMVLFECLTLDIPYRRDRFTRFEIPEKIAQGVRPSFPDKSKMHKSVEPVMRIFNMCTELDASSRPAAKDLGALFDKLSRSDVGVK